MNYKLFFTLLLTAVFMSPVFGQKDPVLMTVDGKNITKSDFLRVYLKNNNEPKYDKQSLDEYLDLYKKFRLKVAEAEHLKYDTIPSLVRELDGYKNQLAQPYLTDSSKLNELIHEAYNRMKYEIKASHILISLREDAPPADTLVAYNKAMALKKKIDSGADFGEIAAGEGGSDDPSAKMNKGELGYFSAFQMVYPFETAAYSSPVGSVSLPIRSKFGYHLVKVTDKRPARGTIKAAHIMVAFSQEANDEELERAEKKINDIYSKLQEGDDFDKLARLYSDDQGTKNNGGVLAEFGTNTTQRMIPEFEEEAFALKNDGDYSKPFKTPYGFHIIKRITWKPLPSFEEMKNEIKTKIERGDRSKISEKTFVNNLKKENKFKDDAKKNLVPFYTAIDSTIFTANWEVPSLKKNQVLFSYRNIEYKSNDFINYLTTKKFRRKIPIVTFVNQEYEAWQTQVIIQDEKSRLVDEYPAYRALMQEYHDGVLLYEIMKDKVWDKAIKDTTGLHSFFNKNISSYQWPKRIEATIYSSDKKENVQEALELSKIDTLTMENILERVNEDTELNLSAKSGKFIPENEAELNGKNLKKGANPIFQEGDKYYFIIVEAFLPAGSKELNETKGTVIQDYQNYLEKTWLDELSKKYPITVDEAVLYSLGK